MYEKTIEYLKQKYEYIEFTNNIYNLLDKIKKDIEKTSYCESSYRLEFESIFINELIKQVHNGNKEYYDAIEIANENLLDFIKIKRKDLLDNITENRLNKLYQEAFEITVKNWNKPENLQTKIIKNLINLLHLEKEGDYKMKKEKSLYVEFKEYDEQLIKIVANYFKRNEKTSYQLLIKKYGTNLDGQNVNEHLLYYEIQRLETIIIRFKSYLDYAKTLQNNGLTNAKIKEKFEKITEQKLRDEINNIKNKKNSVEIESKEQLLKKYSVSEKKLSDILDFSKEIENVKLFKEYFGIEHQKISEQELLVNYRISKQDLLKKIKETYLSIPELKEEYDSYMETYKDNKKAKKVSTNKKTSLFEFFPSDKKDFVINILNIYKEINKDNYEFLQSIYGENFDSVTDKKLTAEERIRKNNIIIYFKQLVQSNHLPKAKVQKIKTKPEQEKVKEDTIKAEPENNEIKKTVEKIAPEITEVKVEEPKLEIIEEKNEEDLSKTTKPQKKGRKFVSSFYGYFKEDEIPKAKEIMKIYKEKDHKYYKLMINLFGENLDNYDDSLASEEDRKEKTHAIATIKKLIKNGQLPKKNKNNISKKETLFAYFEEDEYEKVKEYLNEYKVLNHKYYHIVIKIFGETYDKFDENVELTKEEKKTFANAVTTLKVRIRKTYSKKSAENSKEILKQAPKQIITNKDKKEVLKEEPIKKEQTVKDILDLILEIDPLHKISAEELLTLTTIYNNINNLETISKVLNKDIKELEEIIIKYLILFKSNLVDVLTIILKNNNYGIDYIINNSFLIEEFNYLTPKEQLYIKLKLESLKNPEIKEIINNTLNEDYFKEYKIESQSDVLNSLNLILKKEDN